MSDCTAKITLGRKLKRRSIHLNFDGGDVSGIGGVQLLRAADDRLGLCQSTAKCLPDPRDQNLVTHSWTSLFRQRIYAIAAGFSDLNDHQQLRLDAALQSAVGVLDPMGSAPTLCRLEAAAAQLDPVAGRRVVFDMHRLILERFIASFNKPPRSLVLDFDGTDDRVHGEQESRDYNSHYGGYGFFPLYVYCGEKLLVKGLRAHWPNVNIVFRGDAGFYRPLLLSCSGSAEPTSITSAGRGKFLSAKILNWAVSGYSKTSITGQTRGSARAVSSPK